MRPLEAAVASRPKKLNISDTVGRRTKVRPLFYLNYMAFNIIKWSYFFDSRPFVASRPKKLKILETIGQKTKIKPLFIHTLHQSVLVTLDPAAQ